MFDSKFCTEVDSRTNFQLEIFKKKQFDFTKLWNCKNIISQKMETSLLYALNSSARLNVVNRYDIE